MKHVNVLRLSDKDKLHLTELLEKKHKAEDEVTEFKDALKNECFKGLQVYKEYGGKYSTIIFTDDGYAVVTWWTKEDDNECKEAVPDSL